MIHHGDLFDVLPTLPEASIDASSRMVPTGSGSWGASGTRSSREPAPRGN
jgi:hypothetical protein